MQTRRYRVELAIGPQDGLRLVLTGAALRHERPLRDSAAAFDRLGPGIYRLEVHGPRFVVARRIVLERSGDLHVRLRCSA